MDDACVVLCSRNARPQKCRVGRAQWDHGRRCPLIFKKAEGSFGVLLGMERHIEACLSEREAKEFSFARAVVDQEDGGMRRHIQMTPQGLCRAKLSSVERRNVDE